MSPLSTPPLKIIGHRGNKNLENALPSFEEALQHGAKGIEFDIQLSSDLVPVVIHDETLDRTTTGFGTVSHYPYSQLQDLRLKDIHQQKTTHAIPTLKQVLELCARWTTWIPDLWINVEIKDPRATIPVLSLIDCFIHSGSLKEHHVVLSSFDHHVLYRVRKENPSLPLGILFEDEQLHAIAALVKDLKPVSLHFNQYQMKTPHAQSLRGKIPFVAWFAKEPLFPENLTMLEDSVHYGALTLITNHPAEVVNHRVKVKP
ncbi:MAG: hypothetical protein IPP74_07385 [Alphaproteobacteria bacterium]|nr:hypothetical protein [Alphaproteobacteria bacterium]